MDKIISKVYQIIKYSSNLIGTEEAIHVYMYDVFAQVMGQIFSNFNQVIKDEKQHEGWEKNEKRVSLKEPKAIMTTKKTAGFWAEVQAFTASSYSLQQAQIITNSDGGQGYTADKFQEAFSQSNYPVLNQLDSYHVFQGLNRAFVVQTNVFKGHVKQALKTHGLDELTIWLDTYESTLEEPAAVEKLNTFRTYVLRNWDRIFDWRKKVEQVPKDARGLGAMESNQRHISFRMKKRGMHWSAEGCEAMVKIKQGLLNHTLREAYLHQQNRSTRQQRKLKKTVRLSSLLHEKKRQSVGAKNGTIPLYASHSSAIGQLLKSFR